MVIFLLASSIPLFLLYKQGSCNIAEIAENSAISHNAASRMVDRLVQGEYVILVEDQHDRRLKKVSLTIAGFNKLKELQIIATDVYNQVLSTAPVELQQQLEVTLKQIEPYLPKTTCFVVDRQGQEVEV